MTYINKEVLSREYIQYYKEEIEFATIYNRIELNLYFIIELTLRKLLETDYKVTNISTWKTHTGNLTRIREKFPDFVVLSKENNGYDEICMIEVKYLPFNSEYQLDKHEKQVREQQIDSSINYSILTNGIEFRFYNKEHVETLVLGTYKKDVIEWSEDFELTWKQLVNKTKDFIKESDKDRVMK